MAITRLSGGTTPPNGSDPRTFPAIWNDAVDDIEASEAAITTLEGSVTALQSDITNLEVDNLADVTIANVADGEILVYDTGNWVNQSAPENTGFTASTTITATNSSFPVPSLAHPIARVTVIGGGGGGAGGSFSGSGGGGGTGGTTTFNAGTAGTVSATGGLGAISLNTQSGRAGTAGFASANGGQHGVWNNDSNSRNSTSGSGGFINVAYVNLSGISTVSVTIGGGGAGGSSTVNGGAGGRGEVILEFVAA